MHVSILKVILSWRMLVTFFLGISSGIPLLVTGSTLQAWMTDEKVDLAVIGMFSLVGLPYTVKFLWAPVMDRYVPPFLGRRRGWMLISQILLMLAIGTFSLVRPAESPWIVAFLAVLVSFFSASQDIVVDAYRRELLR
ncbi:MAG: transporter, family, beta-lactamase induction signal transducer AmpG, partial [Planctomycetota bacterium]|nr:transporter, family, beta-lactamase induction signal transducer AmpG [Planctomycetota bacterium]